MTAPIRNNNVIDPFSWDKNVIDFKGYNGSPNLKKSGIKVNWTQEMLDEWIKCAKDPIYFSERYIKIVHVDRGLIPIQLYDYQKEVIKNFGDNRKNIVLQSRQSGKTTTATCLILHYILFNEYKTVALLANKGDAALEIMGRIQLAYEYLPKWMQSGVIEWNKGSIEIENGCKILASATSGSAIRGKSCVSGDTIVRVKDKNNGCVYDTEIENINQHDYMIWDGDEFRTFDDVLIQEKETYQITYSNGTIRATEDHMFKTHDGKWICVSDIVVGQSLYGDNTVFSIEKYGTEFVYDPVNINVSNQYVSNGLISHNCSLLYIDECVAGDTSITVRNKYTGEVKRVTIEEFYDAICI